MVCGCFLIVALALMLEGRFREWNAENRYREALVTGYRNAWLGITNLELQRMQVHVAPINRNDLAISALAQRDPILYADSLRNNILSLQDSLIPPQLETVTVPQTSFFYHNSQRSDRGFAGRTSVDPATTDGRRPPSLASSCPVARLSGSSGQGVDADSRHDQAARRQFRFSRGFRHPVAQRSFRH